MIELLLWHAERGIFIWNAWLHQYEAASLTNLL